MSVDRSGILILFKPQDWTSFDVIAKARSNNMPNDNIERSIKKAVS